MSAQAGLRSAALALGLAALAACGQPTSERGSLMLAISTDMYVDKDLSRVDIVVQPESGPMQSTQVNLFPELEGQFLPGTFSIIEGSEPGEFVRVRIIARQDSRVRVVREAALRVPRKRTALLSMPIQWLCDGQVRADGQLHRSDCEEGYTCVSGACQPDAIDEASLPDYVAAEVFGGGDATGNGTCFDTVPCFEGSVEPALDLDTCRLPAAADEDLNVAVLLPPGGDGHCTSSDCWIPLDQSELSGWYPVEGGSVQLPQAICARVRAGTARVRTSSACAAKTPAMPTCGPWTLVGSPPGGDVDPVDPGPSFDATQQALIDDLGNVSRDLALRLANACASLAKMTAPPEAKAAELAAICALASTELRSHGPLTWYRTPSTCWNDHEEQARCERACDTACVTAALEERCDPSELRGSCNGICGSRQCLGVEGEVFACTGACSGTCGGSCEGTCVGQCDGNCQFPSPDGFCDGPCDGTCVGLCQGRCDGSCVGHCNGDPNLPPSACDGEARCMGGCEGSHANASCDAPLASSGCHPGCEGTCGARARVNMTCERPRVFLLPRTGFDPELATLLGQVLPELLTLSDMQASGLRDEGTRLRQRIEEDPGASAEDRASVQAALDLLDAVLAASGQLVIDVGPSRGNAPITPINPGFTCNTVTASGSPTLIDDFEDGDTLVLPNDGRDGAWHVSHDGTGQLSTGDPLVPVAGGANDTAHSLALSGSNFSQWGAAVSLDLRQGGNRYDASVHQGLSFWARGSGPLRVIFMQSDLALGHACSTCESASGECGLFYKTEVFLSEVWSPIFIEWGVLARDTEGGRPFSPANLLAIQFEAPGAEAFEFQIDEVEFY